MENTAQNNTLVTWSTSKNADGTFTGTCFAFFAFSKPVNGRNTSKNITLFQAVCATRAIAKKCGNISQPDMLQTTQHSQPKP